VLLFNEYQICKARIILSEPMTFTTQNGAICNHYPSCFVVVLATATALCVGLSKMSSRK